MSYTRPGESGHYIFAGSDYVDFTCESVSNDAIDVFLYKLYNRRDNEFWERYHRGSRIINNFQHRGISIRQLTKNAPDDLASHTTCIATLAGEIWREHYTPIIGSAQVEYMLAKFQSTEQIYADIKENGYVYFTAKCEKNYQDNCIIGYCAVVPKDNHLFLSKMYVKSEDRGRGIAQGFLEEAYALCRWKYGLDKIRLTVNKNNDNAIAAYRKMGFDVVDSVKADIGGGFFMDDYIMERQMVWPIKREEEYHAQKPAGQ
jgi:ribosomal protein S18 acetylase RimI-like enzyme